MTDRAVDDHRHSPSNWLDYRIYVGPVAGGIEFLVLELLPLVRQWDGVERWFFIRYADDGGPHVRLRVKAGGSIDALRAQADAAVSRALEVLPSVPPPLYRPAVAMDPGSDPAWRRGVIHAETRSYEPETEKFGVRGLTFAEELFQHSSELSIRVIDDERADVCSRKTLVPCLMQRVADAFVPSADSFWRDYAAYWLKVSRVRDTEWRPLFEAKAQELREREVPIVTAAAELPKPSASALENWQRALTTTAHAYRDIAEERVRPIALAFNFAHLMNNRLGIGPLEEAYYATLMQEDARRWC